MTKTTAEGDRRSVAVVGMACRFPGASDPEQLWDVLRDGLDTTGETPPDRYDVDVLYSPFPYRGS